MSLLQIESVSKSFWRGATEHRVLRGISLEVREGEFVAVYGQRNSGKTALLKVAAGFETPDAGRVSFRGADVARMSRRAFMRLHRDEIGWVDHAGPRSTGLSMRAYVAMPLLGDMAATQAQRKADAALAEVGVEDCADQEWDELSDAARMLVVIAHALVRRPSLLIVDDPTVGLGMTDRDLIVGLLRSTATIQGVGVLMAVPDLPAMVQADRVHSLGRGRLLSASGVAEPPRDNVVEFPGGWGGG